MSRRTLELAVAHVRRLAAPPQIKDAADRDLLRAFCEGHDHAAFAELVQRHGPLVLALCRRWLRQPQDAEDAFQAVFLVLVQKAASVRHHDSLAGWLHQVAYKACLAARRARARRQRHEERASAAEPADPAMQAAWREVQVVLDEEIQCLPDRFREPFVLCCLEHRSCAEAGQRLGLKEGTVWSRLAEARKRLQARLTRRGVSLSAVLGAMALAPSSTTASVPLGLAAATVRIALAAPCVAVAASAVSSSVFDLARDMTRVLFLARIKAYLLLVVAFGTLGGAAGGVVFLQPSQAAPQAAQQPQAAAPRPRVDNYRDPLPAGVVQRLGTVRFRHEPGIWCVAFSPDGRLVASGCHNIRLWDRRTGQEVRRFGGDAVLLAFTPDGKYLISAPQWNSSDYSVRKWDVATGKEALRFTPKRRSGHFGDVALSPDAKTAAVCSGGTLDLCDVDTGTVRRSYPTDLPRFRFVQRLQFSPSGRELALVAPGYGVSLVDLGTGLTMWWNRDQHKERDSWNPDVSEPAFAPDGKTLAVRVDGQKPARLLDTATGREIYSFNPGLGGFVFSQDGKRLFAGGIWEAATGKRYGPLEMPFNDRPNLALSPDGRVLAAGAGQVLRFWDSTTGKVLPGLTGAQGHVIQIAVSPDGKHVLAAAAYDQEADVRCWNLPTGRQRFLWKGRARSVAAFAADGATLALVEGDRLALRDAGSWREIWSVPAGELGVAVLAFTRDGKRLVGTTYRRGAIRIWDTATGRERAPFGSLQLRQLRQAVALSPDGQYLAAGGWERVIRIWDTSTQQQVSELHGQQADLRRIGFSPDGKSLAAVSGGGRGEDRSIRIWEIATGRVAKTIDGPAGGSWSVAWSPDGRLLATGGEDGKVRLWNVATGRERACLSGHQGPVTALTFTADGSRLLSGSTDTTVLVWDVAHLRD